MDKQQILHELTMRLLPSQVIHNMTEEYVLDYIETYAKVETAYDRITAEKEAKKTPPQPE